MRRGQHVPSASAWSSSGRGVVGWVRGNNPEITGLSDMDEGVAWKMRGGVRGDSPMVRSETPSP